MKTVRPIVQLMLVLAVLAVIAGCAGSRTTESTGQYVDDSAITTKVKAAIFDDPTLKVFEISVETFKGVVQLSGFVSSQEVRSRAGVVAGRVSGVQSVRNNLVVK